MSNEVKKPDTGKVVRRQFSVSAPRESGERMLEFSFASEDPYRRWFGYEVLGLKPDEVRMGRLEDKAPMLLDHRNELEYQIGVVTKAWIDEKVGRVECKLFDGYTRQGGRASDFLEILRQGAGGKISVGYIVYKFSDEPVDEIDGVPVFRAVDWEPMEVSAVAVAADDGVGVGKSAPESVKQEAEMSDAVNPAGDTAKQEAAPEAAVRSADTGVGAPAPEPVVVRDNGKARADILAIAQSEKFAKYGAEKLAMAELAKAEPSVEGFRASLMDQMVDASLPTKGADVQGGIPAEEQRKFNLGNLVRAMIYKQDGDHAKAEKVGGFELELSKAHTDRAVAQGIPIEGHAFPIGVLAENAARLGAVSTRVSSVGGLESTVAQADLRGTDHRGDLFVEHLYNASAFLGEGATVMEGLVGNIDVPYEGTVIQAEWLNEGEAKSPDDPRFGKFTMTPHRLSAGVVRTRQLLLQSDPSIDRILMRELVMGMAVAEDYAIINGTGGSTKAPQGLMTADVATAAAPRGVNELPVARQGVKTANNGGAGTFAGPDGSALTWADIVALESEITAQNLPMDGMRYWFNSKTVGKLKTTEIAGGTNGVFIIDLRAPGMVNGHSYRMTNQLHSNLQGGGAQDVRSRPRDPAQPADVFSQCVAGHAENIYVGHWGGASVQIDPYSRLDRDEVRLFIHRYVDFALKRPQAFTRIPFGIITA